MHLNFRCASGRSRDVMRMLEMFLLVGSVEPTRFGASDLFMQYISGLEKLNVEIIQFTSKLQPRIFHAAFLLCTRWMSLTLWGFLSPFQHVFKCEVDPRGKWILCSQLLNIVSLHLAKFSTSYEWISCSTDGEHHLDAQVIWALWDLLRVNVQMTLFQRLPLLFPVSKSHASSQREEALLENVTRLGEHSETLQKSLSQLPSQSDLLENIWKLESLFHNHSEQLQLLGNHPSAKQKSLESYLYPLDGQFLIAILIPTIVYLLFW